MPSARSFVPPPVAVAATLVAVGLGLGRVSPASAHAIRSFGPYTVAIGWAHEPAFVGEPNAVQVIVKDAKGNPVTDVGPDDLKVTVSLGDHSLGPLALEPSFDPDTRVGTPGDYEAALIPTVVGDYTVRLTGIIHGQAIDAAVTTGPNTFATVDSARDIEFPTQVPAVPELATAVNRIASRAATARTAAETAAAAARSARDAADRALVVAVAAIVVAVVGTGAGFLVGRRRSS